MNELRMQLETLNTLLVNKNINHDYIINKTIEDKIILRIRTRGITNIVDSGTSDAISEIIDMLIEIHQHHI